VAFVLVDDYPASSSSGGLADEGGSRDSVIRKLSTVVVDSLDFLYILRLVNPKPGFHLFSLVPWDRVFKVSTPPSCVEASLSLCA